MVLYDTLRNKKEDDSKSRQQHTTDKKKEEEEARPLFCSFRACLVAWFVGYHTPTPKSSFVLGNLVVGRPVT